MGDLTASLSRYEIACSCKCGYDTIDYETVILHQKMVDHFGGYEKVMLVITGPIRCRTHNSNIGGATESQHIYGRGLDSKLIYRDTGEQISPTRVYKYLCDTYPDRYGFGLYSNRVHADTRTNGPARWQV